MRQPYDAENIRSTHCIISNDVSLPMQSNEIQCDRHSQHLDSHYIYPSRVQCASNVHFVFAFIVMEMCSVFSANAAVPGSLANLFTAHIVSGVFAFTESVTFPALFSFFCISVRFCLIRQPPPSSIAHTVFPICSCVNQQCNPAPLIRLAGIFHISYILTVCKLK